MKREPGRKLLYVDNDFHTFCLHRYDLVRAAVRNGYEVHVAVPAGTVDAVPGPFELHTYELRRRGLNPLREALTVADLHQLFRRIRPDIVHLLRLKPVMYGGLAARTANVPAVVCSLTGLGYAFTISGHKGRALRAVAQAALRVVTRHPNVCMTVENLENKQELVAANIVGERGCQVIRGVGIDAARYQCQPEPAGPLIVLLAARMLWDKGVGEFVEAATLLRSSGVKARFVLVGAPDPGNPASISNAQLEEWNREGSVEWWGWREDMVAVFSAAHVVCLPTSYGEGVPRCLIEAAACSRPIVATDVPGCRDIVHDGDNGFLVPTRNAPELSLAIGHLLNDAVLRQRFGRAGRARVLSEFGNEHVLGKIFDIYRDLRDASDQRLAGCAPMTRPADLS